jgi:voltage-gated potassium channel
MNLRAEVSGATPRKVMVVAAVRAVATIAILVAAYYLLPLDKLANTGTLLLLVLGMIAVIVMFEVKAILNAKYPGVKAVGALAVLAPLFLLAFSAAYYLLERSTPTQPLTATASCQLVR